LDYGLIALGFGGALAVAVFMIIRPMQRGLARITELEL
jgi:hypothetical protein